MQSTCCSSLATSFWSCLIPLHKSYTICRLSDSSSRFQYSSHPKMIPHRQSILGQVSAMHLYLILQHFDESTFKQEVYKPRSYRFCEHMPLKERKVSHKHIPTSTFRALIACASCGQLFSLLRECHIRKKNCMHLSCTKCLDH